MRRSAESPEQATGNDLPAVAQDLSDAFSADPHFDWFLRADARRREGREALFRYMVGKMAWPLCRIDRPAGGGAAAVWAPFEWLKPSSLVDEVRNLGPILKATGLSRLSRLAAIRATMDRKHPMDRPHAYLWFLGVTPAAQGMGVGSRLLRAGLNRVDAEGLPAYLETGTERNVALYSRHGFKIIDQGPPAPGAPTMWHMWREADGG